MEIYLIKNFSLREVYYGLADQNAKEAVSQHKLAADSPLSHWSWSTEEIKWGVVETGLHEVYARAFIQALRREPLEDGWILVVGGEDFAGGAGAESQ